MKFVNSLPPLAETPDAVGIRELQRAQAVRPLRERLFPAHIVEHYPHQEAVAEQAFVELKEDKRSDKERRQFCRRIESVKLLLDTRSHIERRRINRRRDDAATSVDEEV